MSHPSRTAEELDDDPQVNQLQGCSKLYTQLEACLGEKDRDWRACQKEVQALKSCYQAAQRSHAAAGHNGKAVLPMTDLPVRYLYRRLLKAASQFPSIKRPQLIQNIKLEFQENKSLTDPEKVKQQIRVAVRGLSQMEEYTGLDKKSKDWSVHLKGATLD